MFLPVWGATATIQAQATPIIAASAEAELDPAIAWSEVITSKVAAANRADKIALEAIVSSLYDWAKVDAMSRVTGSARGIFPRRVSKPVMAWRAVRWQAKFDPRAAVIDRWAYATGKRMRTIFGLGDGLSGMVLNYNNNLQATAAMVAYAAGVISGDSSLRYWAIMSSEEVLDQIDASGFTIEIYRSNSEKAEYYSHETMIYLIATAQMAGRIGNTTLWSYRGQKAGTSSDPALLRAGRLLNADLGTAYRYTARTGRAQIPYPLGHLIGSIFAPSGYLECWFTPFLQKYGSSAFGRLRLVDLAYDLSPQLRYNSGVGGWMVQ